MPALGTVHRMKITLRGVRPPIWRRIEVPSNVTMHELSAVLEAAMGWGGGHLHAFVAGGMTYQLPSEFDGFSRYETKDERKVRLSKVLTDVGDKMRFEYDFGDGWEHDVVLEAITMRVDGVTYPRCITGKRACPPDDCGGPWGYANLLEVLADHKHPDYVDVFGSTGRPVEPEAFDATETTIAMQHAEPWNG